MLRTLLNILIFQQPVPTAYIGKYGNIIIIKF